LKTFPIVNKAIFKDTFWITILFRKSTIEINLALLPSIFIYLNILDIIFFTEGAMTSGLYLPAKPILVLRDPTSIINGMP
jgi:hypothetical protein